MRFAFGLVASSSAFIFHASAFAATVTPKQGEVLVNQGSGYKSVTQPTEVAVGDQLMVKPKSSGRIVFPDGCTVNVSPGGVFIIPAKSPCERSGRHVETVGSVTSEKSVGDDGSYALPSLLAAGMPVGIILLRDHLKPASP
jgi:hypothetical protein